MAYGGIHDPLLSNWIYPPVGQSSSHYGQILGAHVQRTLFGIEIDCWGRIDVNSSVALQQPGNALVAIVSFGGRKVNLIVQRQPSSSEARQPFVNEVPFVFKSDPRYQAGCSNRTRINHRIGPAIRAPFNAG